MDRKHLAGATDCDAVAVSTSGAGLIWHRRSLVAEFRGALLAAAERLVIEPVTAKSRRARLSGPPFDVRPEPH